MRSILVTDHARTRGVALLLPALVITAVASLISLQHYFGIFQGSTFPAGQQVTIHGSSTFPLDDPELVAGYSDFIVDATIIAEVGHVEPHSTRYVIEIEESFKGHLNGSWEVLQSGFRRGQHVYVAEDQPRLEVGNSHVLSLVIDADGESLRVLGGPIAALETANSDARTNPVVAAREVAKWPPDLAHLQSSAQELRAAWVSSHPGSR